MLPVMITDYIISFPVRKPEGFRAPEGRFLLTVAIFQ
jgi:hypothetical protein